MINELYLKNRFSAQAEHTGHLSADKILSD